MLSVCHSSFPFAIISATASHLSSLRSARLFLNPACCPKVIFSLHQTMRLVPWLHADHGHLSLSYKVGLLFAMTLIFPLLRIPFLSLSIWEVFTQSLRPSWKAYPSVPSRAACKILCSSKTWLPALLYQMARCAVTNVLECLPCRGTTCM